MGMMMLNVVYVAPFPMETTLRFAKALSSQPKTRLLGVFQSPPQGLAARFFHDIVTIPQALSAHHIEKAILHIRAKYGKRNLPTLVTELLEGCCIRKPHDCGIRICCLPTCV